MYALLLLISFNLYFSITKRFFSKRDHVIIFVNSSKNLLLNVGVSVGKKIIKNDAIHHLKPGNSALFRFRESFSFQEGGYKISIEGEHIGECGHVNVLTNKDILTIVKIFRNNSNLNIVCDYLIE